MYKGQLEGFPKEVVEKMLERQEEQGNERDVSVFEEGKFAGFYFEDTEEGRYFWDDVIRNRNFNVFFEKYPKFEGEIKGLNVFQKPTTKEERDKLIQELQAMEFKKELSSELDNCKFAVSKEELKLFKLLRMRDVYRDGWVVSEDYAGYSIDLHFIVGFKIYVNDFSCLPLFSFQNKETAELFLNNFRKDLVEVKHLIS